MMEWTVDDRGVCATLLLAGAVLLTLRPGPRSARLGWGVLLLGALINASVLSLAPRNLINNNNLQQYLGARYVFRYADFQALVNAAREQPQVEVRDLEHPMVILRADPRAQRAYFIDLLRSAHASFDPFTSLDSLRLQCTLSGVLHRESERVLAEGLAPDRVEAFRRDVQAAAPHLQWADITTDYGFNGSPFYALVRQLDPTVHRPFGRWTALFGLAWQAASVGLIVWMLTLTFALRRSECLATAALVFSSWDFVAYALPGLTFAGIWLPAAAAGLAIQRDRRALAGVAIAVAGLMKLFPFILLLPSATAVLVDGWRRIRRSAYSGAEDTRGAWTTILVCAATTVVLGFLSSLGGRSWGDFIAKITAQFGSDSYIQNSVSASHGLLALGIHDSPVVPMVSVLAYGLLFALCARGRVVDGVGRARFYWVLLAGTGFLTHMWLNYYAMAPLFMLPFLARDHRRGAALCAMSLAIAYVLPDFDDPMMRTLSWRALKLAPYLLVPAWMLTIEVRERVDSARVRRAFAVLVAAAAIVIAAETGRMYEVRRLERRGGAALDAGNVAAATTAYTSLLRWQPGHAPAEMNLGIALAQSGRMQEAGVRFARAAELAPTDPIIVQDYGMWLRLMGRLPDAETQFEKLCALVPWNDDAWFELARVCFEQGRGSEAGPLIIRALELRPDNLEARALRARIPSGAAPTTVPDASMRR